MVNRIGVLVASLVAVAVIAELGFRVYDGRMRRRILAGRDPPTLVTEAVADGRIYRFRAEVPDFTNSHGFRDLERTRAKPPASYRIAVIGDSVTVDRTIPFESLYVRRLQRLFDRDSPIGDVELLNFGVTGYGTLQETVLLEREVLAFAPDALLWQFHLNDAADPLIEGADGGLGRYHARPASAFGWWLERRLSGVARRRFIRAQDLDGVPSDLQLQALRWDRIGSALEDLREIAARHRLPVLVFVQPTWPQADDWSDYTPRGFEIVDRLVARFDALGFVTLDFVEVFRQEDPDRYRKTPDDPWHPNAAGHRLIADELHRWLTPILAAPSNPIPQSRRRPVN